MIVGGGSAVPNRRSEDKSYVLPLDPSIDIPSCLETLCDFPHYIASPTGALFNGLPTVCGGRDGATNTYHTECYQFNFTRNSWGDPAEPIGHKNILGVHTGKKIDIDFYLDASGRVVDQDLIVSFG